MISYYYFIYFPQGVSPENVAKVEPLILQELQRCATEGFPKGDPHL